MKRRHGRNCHAGQDQYGETGASQDRDEPFSNPATGSFRGGGSAQGRTDGTGPVRFERHTPKFLKKYEHLLGGKRNREAPEPAEDKSDEEQEDLLRDEHEALSRALEENPELAKELNPSIVNAAKAMQEKVKGNAAYAEGDYPTAVQRFTASIELDPQNEVYYSNRSAVYSAMKEFEKAISDAENVIQMKPTWVKGWARLAVAHFGLEQYSHAKDAYSRALELEPDDNTLISGRNKAEEQERRQIRENKHTFSKTSNKSRKTKKPRTAASSKASKKQGVQISYEDDGEEQK